MNQEKLITLLKRLNKFNLEEVSILAEISLDKLKNEFELLIEMGIIREISDDEYLFIQGLKTKKTLSNKQMRDLEKKQNKLFDNLYFFFRDYYLLYNIPTAEQSIELAKIKFLKTNENFPANKFPTNAAFISRLNREFSSFVINRYRNQSNKNIQKFNEKLIEMEQCKKRTNIKMDCKITIRRKLPEYLDYTINNLLYLILKLCTFEKDNFMLSKNSYEILIKEKSYTLKLSKYYIATYNINSNALDVLIILIYLSKLKAQEKDGSFIINIEDILFLLNRKYDYDKEAKFKSQTKKEIINFMTFLEAIDV
ncbi:MAG: hypothetical protein PHV68_06920 [Candidatus Gastranaerophilales bacterium]|nr:hypothetical protein [Candidatus Gastranaerophilales bacterium]